MSRTPIWWSLGVPSAMLAVLALPLALVGCADMSAGGGPCDASLHYFCYGW